MKIVRCKNGVGEWEIEPTHETFDTYAEAEEHLRKLNEKLFDLTEEDIDRIVAQAFKAVVNPED
tara:strand:- start:8485 stop:8676 length:192 start_codon:yes stop_codon:yes gene_type:complete